MDYLFLSMNKLWYFVSFKKSVHCITVLEGTGIKLFLMCLCYTFSICKGSSDATPFIPRVCNVRSFPSDQSGWKMVHSIDFSQGTSFWFVCLAFLFPISLISAPVFIISLSTYFNFHIFFYFLNIEAEVY